MLDKYHQLINKMLLAINPPEVYFENTVIIEVRLSTSFALFERPARAEVFVVCLSESATVNQLSKEVIDLDQEKGALLKFDLRAIAMPSNGRCVKKSELQILRVRHLTANAFMCESMSTDVRIRRTPG